MIRVGGRGMDCNQFLLKDPKSNAFDVVDAGLGLDFERVLGQIAGHVDPHRIRTIAITHEHLDHVNGLPQWQALGARVATSPATAHKLAAGHDPTSAMFGSDIPTLTVDDVLDDEGILRLGGRDHTVLLTPGHSPGSCCFWEPDDGVLYSGDTVFAGGGIGRFDFPDGDVALLAESILRLERLPARILHCGHGPSVDVDAGASLRSSVAHVQSCLHS